jgi:hypothetical protein
LPPCVSLGVLVPLHWTCRVRVRIRVRVRVKVTFKVRVRIKGLGLGFRKLVVRVVGKG